MAKYSSSGWNPKSFEEVIAKLEGTSMNVALRVNATRSCPAPRWDPDRAYRVALVGDVPTIQRLVDGSWQTAPLEAPKGGDPVTKVRTTQTRLFISHSSEDAALAKELTTLIDGALTVAPPQRMRCTSVPGYKLEPGDDGPDELRENLYDADVVIGLLTGSSLRSAYVLMELGAAWGFKNRVIPLVAAGVDFQKIPGPIGHSVHAVSVTDEEGMASVLDSISRRCEMPWRAAEDRKHALIKQFVRCASEDSSTNPAVSATLVPAPTAPPAPATPTEMSEGDRIARLRIWLSKNENDARAHGTPFPIADIDTEALVPPGTAETYLARALAENWEILRRDGSYIELRYVPRMRVTRGSRQSR